jgi:hypothetical protein
VSKQITFKKSKTTFQLFLMVKIELKKSFKKLQTTFLNGENRDKGIIVLCEETFKTLVSFMMSLSQTTLKHATQW